MNQPPGAAFSLGETGWGQRPGGAAEGRTGRVEAKPPKILERVALWRFTVMAGVNVEMDSPSDG